MPADNTTEVVIQPVADEAAIKKTYLNFEKLYKDIARLEKSLNKPSKNPNRAAEHAEYTRLTTLLKAATAQAGSFGLSMDKMAASSDKAAKATKAVHVSLHSMTAGYSKLTQTAIAGEKTLEKISERRIARDKARVSGFNTMINRSKQMINTINAEHAATKATIAGEKALERIASRRIARDKARKSGFNTMINRAQQTINAVNAEHTVQQRATIAIREQTKVLEENTRASRANNATKGSRSRAKGSGNTNGKEGFFGTMFEGAGTSFGHKIATTAQYATAGSGIYAAANAFRAAGAAALEFDAIIIKLGAVLGASDLQARNMAIGLERLSVAYGGTIDDVNAAALALGRAGVVNEELVKGTEQVIKLAMLTGDTIADTTNVLSTFRQTYGEAAGSVQYLADRLAYAANESRLSTQDLGTLSNYALSAARSIGMTSEQVLALSTAFSNAGVNASTIGTQIRKLSNMFKQAGPGIDSFYDNIGLNQQKLLYMMQSGDTEAAFKEMINAITGASDAQYNAATKNLDILQRDTVDKIRLTGTKILGHYEDLTSDMVDGTTDNANKIALSYEAMAERMRNAFLSFTNEKITGALDSLIGRLNVKEMDEFLDKISDAVEVIETLTVAFVSYKVAMIASQKVTALMATAQVAVAVSTSASTAAVGAFTTAMVAARTATVAFLASLGPLGIAMAVAGAVAYESYEMQQERAKAAADVEKTMKEMAEATKAAAKVEKELQERLAKRSKFQVASDEYAQALKSRTLLEDKLKLNKELLNSDKELAANSIRTIKNHNKTYETQIRLLEQTIDKKRQALVAVGGSRQAGRLEGNITKISSEELARVKELASYVKQLTGEARADGIASNVKIIDEYLVNEKKWLESFKRVAGVDTTAFLDLGPVEAQIFAKQKIIDLAEEEKRVVLEGQDEAAEVIHKQILAYENLTRQAKEYIDLETLKANLLRSNSEDALDYTNRLEKQEAKLREQRAILESRPFEKTDLLREELEIREWLLAEKRFEYDADEASLVTDEQKYKIQVAEIKVNETKIKQLKNETQLYNELVSKQMNLIKARSTQGIARITADDIVTPDEYLEQYNALEERHAQAIAAIKGKSKDAKKDMLALNMEMQAAKDKLESVFDEHTLKIDIQIEGFDSAANALAELANSYGDLNELARQSTKDRIVSETKLAELDTVALNSRQEMYIADVARQEAARDYGEVSAESNAADQAYFDKANQFRGDEKAQLAEAKKMRGNVLKVQAAQIGMYADMTGALAGFYDEDDDRRERQAKVAKAMQAAQMAAQLLSLTQTVTVETAKQGTYATTALAASLAAPFPANLAGFAVVAAMLASLGIAFGGKGSESYDAAAGQEANTGKGTSLGDSDKQSESIAKSLEVLEDMAKPEFRIFSQMNSSLISIEQSLSGLSANIIKTGGFELGEDYTQRAAKDPGKIAEGKGEALLVTGGAIAGGVIGSMFGPIGTIVGAAIGTAIGTVVAALDNILLDGLAAKLLENTLGAVIGGLFGKTKYSLDDYGLFFNEQLITEAVESIDGQAYQTIKKTKKSWFSKKTSYSTQFEEMADETARQFSLVLEQFYNTTTLIAPFLDQTAEDVEDTLSTFKVKLGKISFKDKTGEEIQEELAAVFGAVADDMAETAFPLLASFQHVGEGMFETMTRVATGIGEADAYIKRLGFSTIKFTDIANTQGDVAFEALQKSILDFERATYGADNAVVKMIESLELAADELYDVYNVFTLLRSQIRAIGQDSEYLSSAMFLGAGGVEAFANATTSYIDDYLTGVEQLAYHTGLMTDEFDKLGFKLPNSTDAFRALVGSIDTSTDAGQELFGRIIILGEGFKDLVDLADSLKVSLDSIYDSLQPLIDLMQLEADLNATRASAMYKAMLATKQFAESLEELAGTSTAGIAQNIYGSRAEQEYASNLATQQLLTQFSDALSAGDEIGDIQDLYKALRTSIDATVDLGGIDYTENLQSIMEEANADLLNASDVLKVQIVSSAIDMAGLTYDELQSAGLAVASDQLTADQLSWLELQTDGIKYTELIEAGLAVEHSQLTAEQLDALQLDTTGLTNDQLVNLGLAQDDTLSTNKSLGTYLEALLKIENDKIVKDTRALTSESYGLGYQLGYQELIDFSSMTGQTVEEINKLYKTINAMEYVEAGGVTKDYEDLVGLIGGLGTDSEELSILTTLFNEGVLGENIAEAFGKVLTDNAFFSFTEGTLSFEELIAQYSASNEQILDFVSQGILSQGVAEQYVEGRGDSFLTSQELLEMILGAPISEMLDFQDYVLNKELPDTLTGALEGIYGSADDMTIGATLERLLTLMQPISNYTETLSTVGILEGVQGVLTEFVDKLVFERAGGGTISYELPSYDVGSSYISSDQTANIHEGEMVIDRESADALRKYGVNVGSGSNVSAELLAGILTEIRATRKSNEEMQTEIADLKQLQVKQTANSTNQLNATRAILDETITQGE